MRVKMAHRHGYPLRRTAPDAYPKEHPMLDVIMLAIGLGFFALAVGYTYACDRL
jgi:hypothetical protein